MTTTTVDPAGLTIGTLTTVATREAEENWRANISALGQTQPGLVPDGALAGDVEWVYGRDGALTARVNGGWWSGCSVPRRAAAAILRKLRTTGTACLLAPTHATEIEVALGRMAHNEALLVIVPEMRDLVAALHCADFGAEILGKRLWFAAGAEWPGQLREILEAHPGLPIPQQFIRTPLLGEEAAAVLVDRSQAVFSAEAARRGRLLQETLNSADARAARARRRVCVVAPSRFRLWDDAGAVLRGVLEEGEEFEVRALDPDDPCDSAPLAMALGAAGCDAVVVANATRHEIGAFVPAGVRVITWLTAPHVTPFVEPQRRDGLLVADPSWVELARARGWPGDRVGVAAWPYRGMSGAGDEPASAVAVIADTMDVSKPGEPFELSSHQLFWEMIRDEVRKDPFKVGRDPWAYLDQRMREAGMPERGLDRRRFVERLIVPAYPQGIARALLRSGVAVRLHGAGWQTIDEFRGSAAGPIGSGAVLLAAVRDAALVHVWPWELSHPIESLRRPVVRAGSKGELVERARRALRAPQAAPTLSRPLSSRGVFAMLQCPPALPAES